MLIPLIIPPGHSRLGQDGMLSHRSIVCKKPGPRALETNDTQRVVDGRRHSSGDAQRKGTMQKLGGKKNPELATKRTGRSHTVAGSKTPKS